MAVTYDFTGTNGAAWPSPWVDESTPGGNAATIQSNRGALTTTATQWDAANATLAATSANQEISGLFYPASTTQENYFGVWLRGDAFNWMGYVLLFQTNTANIFVNRWLSGSSLQLGSKSGGYTFTAGQPVAFRFRVVGTSIKARVWDPAGAEPSTWDVSVVNSDVSAAGKFQFGFQTGVAASLAAQVDTVVIDDGATDPPSETLRPTGVSGLTSLTGAATDIDQDPDGTITDAGLIGSDPSPAAGSVSNVYPNARAAASGQTGFAWATGGATNVTDTSDTTLSTEASASTTLADYFTFVSGAFSAIPAGSTINTITATIKHRAGTINRLTPFLQLGSANGTLIGSEVNATTNVAGGAGTLGTTAGGITNTVTAWGTLPTLAQLQGSTFGVRLRITRSNTSVYDLYSIKLTVNYTAPGTTVNTQVDVALGNPTLGLATGAVTGEIRARMRKRGSGTNPQGRIELRNASGSWSTTVIADTTISDSSASGQLVSGMFDQSIITDPTDVVARFVGTGAVGGLAELVAVEWNAQNASAILAGKTADLLYNVSALASKTGQVRYDISALASKSGAISYNISGRAGNSGAISYDLRSFASKSGVVRFDISSFASKTGQVLYNISGLASKSAAILYDVLLQAGLAGKQAQISYDVRAFASKSGVVRYDISGLASKTGQIRYDLLGLASKSGAISYNISGRAGNSGAITYNVSAFASKSGVVRFDILTLAGKTGQILFDLRALAGGSRVLLYNVLQTALLAGKQGVIGYDVRALATKTGQLRYDVYVRATKSGILLYSINGRAGKSGVMLYNILGGSLVTLRPDAILSQTGDTKTLADLQRDVT